MAVQKPKFESIFGGVREMLDMAAGRPDQVAQSAPSDAELMDAYGEMLDDVGAIYQEGNTATAADIRKPAGQMRMAGVFKKYDTSSS